MKKIIALILVFSLALACTLPAMADEKKFYVEVNGEEISKYYFTEDGSLMVAVREVADAVKHQVAWDPETGVVSVTDGVNVINLLPDSGEYYFNGEERHSDISVCTINNVTYVSAEVYPMSMGAHTRLEERPTYTWIRIIQPVRFTDSLDMETLTRYNIVSREDLAKDGKITVMEALDAVGRVYGASRVVRPSALSYWNYGNKLTELDYLDDETKCFLSDLFGDTGIIKKEELAKMELDGDLTYGQALTLLVRLVANAGGCMATKAELEYTETYQVYDRAQERGLIYEADMTGAEEPVPRGEFYELLLRSLYVKRYYGGAVLHFDSYINILKERTNQLSA